MAILSLLLEQYGTQSCRGATADLRKPPGIAPLVKRFVMVRVWDAGPVVPLPDCRIMKLSHGRRPRGLTYCLKRVLRVFLHGLEASSSLPSGETCYCEVGFAH